MRGTGGEVLILCYSDLRGEWPYAAAAALQHALAFAKRLRTAGPRRESTETVAGIALALHALHHVTGRAQAPADIVFPDWGKPFVPGGPEFSTSHSGDWVGCAVVARGVVGLDIEIGEGPRLASWVATKAALEACGAPVALAAEVAVDDDRASFRGRRLHRLSLDVFDGALACVMAGEPVRALEAHLVALPDLYG